MADLMVLVVSLLVSLRPIRTSCIAAFGFCLPHNTRVLAACNFTAYTPWLNPRPWCRQTIRLSWPTCLSAFGLFRLDRTRLTFFAAPTALVLSLLVGFRPIRRGRSAYSVSADTTAFEVSRLVSFRPICPISTVAFGFGQPYGPRNLSASPTSASADPTTSVASLHVSLWPIRPSVLAAFGFCRPYVSRGRAIFPPTAHTAWAHRSAWLNPTPRRS